MSTGRRGKGTGRPFAVLFGQLLRKSPGDDVVELLKHLGATLSGTNSIGLSYTSFGLTLIGGLTTATLLTLLVVPVFYTLFDDLRVAIPAFLNALRRRSEGTPAVSPD